MILGVPGEVWKILPEKAIDKAKQVAEKYVLYGNLLGEQLKPVH